MNLILASGTKILPGSSQAGVEGATRRCRKELIEDSPNDINRALKVWPQVIEALEPRRNRIEQIIPGRARYGLVRCIHSESIFGQFSPQKCLEIGLSWVRAVA